MKRIVPLILLMMILLSACGGQNPDPLAELLPFEGKTVTVTGRTDTKVTLWTEDDTSVTVHADTVYFDEAVIDENGVSGFKNHRVDSEFTDPAKGKLQAEVLKDGSVYVTVTQDLVPGPMDAMVNEAYGEFLKELADPANPVYVPGDQIALIDTAVTPLEKCQKMRDYAFPWIQPIPQFCRQATYHTVSSNAPFRMDFTHPEPGAFLTCGEFISNSHRIVSVLKTGDQVIRNGHINDNILVYAEFRSPDTILVTVENYSGEYPITQPFYLPSGVTLSFPWKDVDPDKEFKQEYSFLIDTTECGQ